MTRSLAAVPSITEWDQTLELLAVVFRQIHDFAYEAGGSGGSRGGTDSSPTEETMLNGLDDHDGRQGARSSLVVMGQQLDRTLAAGLGAIRIVQRTGSTIHSQTWTVADAENVANEYEARRRRALTTQVSTRTIRLVLRQAAQNPVT